MKRSPFFYAIAFSFSVLCGSCQLGQSNVDETADFTVLDVGQGDALLVQSESHQILVDVGPPQQSLFEHLERLKIEHLDAVLLTHQDLDHMGALGEILGKIAIDRVYIGPDSGGSRWDSLAAQLRVLKIPVDTIYRGFESKIGSIHMRVLWPQKSWNIQGNGASLVTLFEMGTSTFLNMGDLESEQEEALLQWEKNLKADVLKVGHHGSKTSTSLVWLAQLQPYAAALSVGKANHFGHPDSSTLANLWQFIPKQQIYRTDLQGDLKFVLSKNGIVGLP